MSQFSTTGKQVSLVAPGEEIYSSIVKGGYAFLSGTSQAAPFVTGAVALLRSYALQRGRPIGDQQVKHLLKQTADRLGTALKTKASGYGRLNLADAMRLLDYRLRTQQSARGTATRTAA